MDLSILYFFIIVILVILVTFLVYRHFSFRPSIGNPIQSVPSDVPEESIAIDISNVISSLRTICNNYSRPSKPVSYRRLLVLASHLTSYDYLSYLRLCERISQTNFRSSVIDDGLAELKSVYYQYEGTGD